MNLSLIDQAWTHIDLSIDRPDSGEYDLEWAHQIIQDEIITVLGDIFYLFKKYLNAYDLDLETYYDCFREQEDEEFIRQVNFDMLEGGFVNEFYENENI